MRLLSRFGLAAVVGFSVSALIASASYSLGFWLGRNSYNLRLIIYSSVPFALLLGLAAVVRPKRKAEQQRNTVVGALVGATLGFLYAFIVAGYALALPAFLVLMLSCWVPGGVSAMLAAAPRGDRRWVVIGIAILCLAAIVLTEPIFNAVTHNQQLTVALVAPSEMSTARLQAQPETVGFDNDAEIQAAKNEVLERVRAFGYTEAFRVLSITKEGKGKRSLAIVVLRSPIAREAVLPVPDGSTVVYIQHPENWEKKPEQTPVLHRVITMRPSTTDEGIGYFEIPDAQGVSLEGRIVAKADVYGPDQSVSDLFKQLQSPQTTDQASDQLTNLAKSDARIRTYLAQRIPALIDAGPQYFQPHVPDAAVQYPGPVWQNAVMLASELKLAETTPALVKWVSVSTSPVMTLASATQLRDNPAGQALIRIGDPSIPALRDGLERGNSHERWDCARALVQIGSPRATNTLRDHVTHEPDETLVDFVNRSTAR